jgi:hypothetical protein
VANLGNFCSAVDFGVVAVSDLINYITRMEGADLLGVGIKALWNMEKKGLVPTPSVRINNDKTGRPCLGYNREIFEAWVKTNPVKHTGYLDAEKRRQHYANKATATVNKRVNQDVWNIRSKTKKNFVYEGKAADIILFCRNNLLNRHKFSNQEKI